MNAAPHIQTAGATLRAIRTIHCHQCSMATSHGLAGMIGMRSINALRGSQ